MENAVVVAATADGVIELFERHGAGGTSLTLLGRWEMPRRITYELASTLVLMLQCIVGELEKEGVDTAACSARIADAGLSAVGFERTYKC